EVRIEPSDTSVMDAARFLTEGDFDGMVSLGGGSVLDTAKAAMVYARYPASFSTYFASPVGDGVAVPGPVLPHIACPTTSGTGSEMTALSVIRLMEHDTKFVLASRYILPDEALIDPACTDTLPSRVMASTGFDLLSHAIECYTARAYTHWNKVSSPNARPQIQGANPWSDLHARQALRIADEYLVRGVADSGDQEARDNLMWAATLAGMAFGNSGTHLPHAFSYAVTNLLHDVVTDDYPVPSPFVPHGISVILTSPSVFRFTAQGAPERHLEAAACLGADTGDATPDDAGEVVATRIVEIMRATRLPNGLRGIGFTADDVDALAGSAIRQHRPIANAPRETNRDDAAEIFKNAMSYW
ncbi:MAG: iron-containing alcohol dehydrogenase, partial [Gammaproteobacteria bacterium]|nr:iron-containing alcohol dehydrogenase [Gammaproteobacteria bacterium]